LQVDKLTKFAELKFDTMKCPNCNETLLMTERHQVEIDYCPSCRGIWLDKGELDKLLQFVSQQGDKPESQDRDRYHERPQYDDRYSDYREKSKYPQQHHRKKKSFLSDFFDFD